MSFNFSSLERVRLKLRVKANYFRFSSHCIHLYGNHSIKKQEHYFCQDTVCNQVGAFRRAPLSSFRMKLAFHAQLLSEVVCSYHQELQMTECLAGAARAAGFCPFLFVLLKMFVGFRKGDINAV